MTDQALLARAAKAIGGRLIIAASGRLFGIETKKGCRFPWNPLLDNGDAFELAVELRIDVAHARDYVVSGLGTAGSMRRENGDDCTATRRAIVRAAAEIGRAMP